MSSKPELVARQRQALYWWLLSAAFRTDQRLADRYASLDAIAKALAEQEHLPDELLSPREGIDTLLHKHPELARDLDEISKITAAAEEHTAETPEDSEALDNGAAPPANGAAAPASASTSATSEPPASEPAAHLGEDPTEEGTLRRGLVFGKLLLNVLGPSTFAPSVTAQQLTQWQHDAAHFERALGYPPGGLTGKSGGGGGGGGGSAGASAYGTGGAPNLYDEDLRRGLEALQGDLVKRMAIHEVLKDNELAAQLTPSLALVEQILRAKHSLSEEALGNARKLVRAYVDKLAEVLKTRVAKALRGTLDRSVAPKRVFRNLDLKKTVWRNLTNWDSRERRLYVNQLYYKRTARKETPTRLIIVVDQSGSMVDAMVQSTILASIFAGLPRVDVHLFAFDTVTVDLTPYVSDPLEVLLRTNLGGGTLINAALMEAEKKVVEPKNTCLVLISDFYEGGPDQPLFDRMKALKDSGVNVIPVGGLSSSGYVMLNDSFATRLKQLGAPVLTGNVDKLIAKLRYLLG